MNAQTVQKQSRLYAQILLWGTIIFLALIGAWPIVIAVLILSLIWRIFFRSILTARNLKRDSTAEKILNADLRNRSKSMKQS